MQACVSKKYSLNLLSQKYLLGNIWSKFIGKFGPWKYVIMWPKATWWKFSEVEACGTALRWLIRAPPTTFQVFIQCLSTVIPNCDLKVLFCLRQCFAFSPWTSPPVPEQRTYACKRQQWVCVRSCFVNHVCGLVIDQMVFTASLFSYPPRLSSIVFFWFLLLNQIPVFNSTWILQLGKEEGSHQSVGNPFLLNAVKELQKHIVLMYSLNSELYQTCNMHTEPQEDCVFEVFISHFSENFCLGLLLHCLNLKNKKIKINK